MKKKKMNKPEEATKKRRTTKDYRSVRGFSAPPPSLQECTIFALATMMKNEITNKKQKK